MYFSIRCNFPFIEITFLILANIITHTLHSYMIYVFSYLWNIKKIFLIFIEFVKDPINQSYTSIILLVVMYFKNTMDTMTTSVENKIHMMARRFIGYIKINILPRLHSISLIRPKVKFFGVCCMYRCRWTCSCACSVDECSL